MWFNLVKCLEIAAKIVSQFRIVQIICCIELARCRHSWIVLIVINGYATSSQFKCNFIYNNKIWGFQKLIKKRQTDFTWAVVRKIYKFIFSINFFFIQIVNIKIQIINYQLKTCRYLASRQYSSIQILDDLLLTVLNIFELKIKI